MNTLKKMPTKKIPTGIPGLDEVLYGGIPKGRALLIIGAAGTGKTTFLNSFLYNGITEHNENGVFVTFEEKPNDIANNVLGFGWDYAKLVRQKKLAFVDLSPDVNSFQETEAGDYSLIPIIERIKGAIRRVRARRVVIDSLGTVLTKYASTSRVRAAMFHLCEVLNGLGVTTLITSEGSGSGTFFSQHGVEEYVVDSVVELNVRFGQQKVVREIIVRKMRGMNFRSGKVEYEITPSGLEIFPKIPIDRNVSLIDFNRRRRYGIPKLDEAMGGGLRQGQILLLSGNTGTGKTLLGYHFINEGLRRGEGCVFVATEEHIDETVKRARLHGFSFSRYQKNGKLVFVSPDSLIDISNDKLLYQILSAAKRVNASRIVVDSISSLLSATMSEEQVRQFMLQLATICKSRGIACQLNYLANTSFGAESEQLLGTMETNMMRLSSIVDAILILRFVEREQSVQKILTVLKVRGVGHSNNLFHYEIKRNGFHLGPRYKR